jgi:hypothetical protein
MLLDALWTLDIGPGRVQAALLPNDDEYDIIAYACALWTSSKGGSWTANREPKVSTVTYRVGFRDVLTLHVPTAIRDAHDAARTEIDRAQMVRSAIDSMLIRLTPKESQ